MPRPSSYAVFCLKKKTDNILSALVLSPKQDALFVANSASNSTTDYSLNSLYDSHIRSTTVIAFSDCHTQSITYLTPAGSFFFFNDTPSTEIYTLSLHDALPILTTLEISFAVAPI